MSIREFLNTCHFGNVQAVVRSNPPQQSMDVVLYRLFREVQTRGYFDCSHIISVTTTARERGAWVRPVRL